MPIRTAKGMTLTDPACRRLPALAGTSRDGAVRRLDTRESGGARSTLTHTGSCQSRATISVTPGCPPAGRTVGGYAGFGTGALKYGLCASRLNAVKALGDEVNRQS